MLWGESNPCGLDGVRTLVPLCRPQLAWQEHAGERG